MLSTFVQPSNELQHLFCRDICYSLARISSMGRWGTHPPPPFGGKQSSKTDTNLSVWGRTLPAGPVNTQGHHSHFPISKCGSWTALREVTRDRLHQKSLPTDSRPACLLHQGSGCSGKPPESADITLIRKHCGKVELTQLEEDSD